MIYYSQLNHPYMKLIIAASDRGLVFVGTDHATLQEMMGECHKQFPQCEIYEDGQFKDPYISQFIEYLDGRRKEFTLPFDIQGTPFQREVWKVLCDIPYGKTMTYSEVAERIKKPKAVRAVGGAVGKNPLSIIIPCHRVIGKDGSLTGYSGGLDVKKVAGIGRHPLLNR